MDKKLILNLLIFTLIVVCIFFYYLYGRFNTEEESLLDNKEVEDLSSWIEAYKKIKINGGEFEIIKNTSKNILIYKFNNNNKIDLKDIESKEIQFNICKFLKHYINVILNIYKKDIELKSVEVSSKENDSSKSNYVDVFYFIPSSYENNIFNNLTDINSIRLILNKIHSTRLHEYFLNFLFKYIHVLDNIRDYSGKLEIKEDVVKKCYNRAQKLKIFLYDLIINNKESDKYKKLTDLFKNTTLLNVMRARKNLENEDNQISSILRKELNNNSFLSNDVIIQEKETLTLIDYFFYILQQY